MPLLFLVGYILALWQYLHELQPITSDVRHAFGRLNSRLAEAIDGIETVKGMAQEEMEVERFGENANRYKAAFVRQGDVEARFIPLLLLVLAEAAALLQSLVLFRQGLLNVGDVVAYFSLMQLFGFPTFVSLFAYSQISLGIAGAKRILELINRQNDLDQNTQGYRGSTSNVGPTDVGPTGVGPTGVGQLMANWCCANWYWTSRSGRGQRHAGEIEFRDVTFSYENGEPALDHITFKVKAGQTVAIVGQTGSGKTTLVKLVNRTYDVSSGQVLVDGVDVRQWNLEALRRGISMIEQDIFLFSRSITENIAFGNPNASVEDIRKAARAAQADEFIYGFEADYETVIGERGVTLSGGQRQRLALARAFLTDPPILVLDDSTSAIDSATEDRIQRAIYTAARGRTTLMITHRLSQIRWADLILVLRKGRLVAMGDHDELMRTSEAYRRIFHEG